MQCSQAPSPSTPFRLSRFDADIPNSPGKHKSKGKSSWRPSSLLKGESRMYGSSKAWPSPNF